MEMRGATRRGGHFAPAVHDHPADEPARARPVARVSPNELDAAALWPETAELIATFRSVCSEDDIAAGLAALYAYESQIPAVSKSKIDGLIRHYYFDDPESYRHFTVHIEADREHAATERALLETPRQLLNISTRLRVLTGENVLIGGFIVTGTESKKVIVRAIGPSLGALGVAGALADPTLELHEPDGTVVMNDNWKDTQEAEIMATTIPPSDDLESAIVDTLVPGAYTAIVRGKNDTTGVALVEAYNLQ